MALDLPVTGRSASRPPPPRPAGALARRAGLVALEVVVPVGLLALWWTLSADSTSVYFPPLADIVDAVRTVWLFEHVGSDAVPTLVHLAAGYVIATVVGVLGGLLFGLVPALGDAFAPVLEFLRAVPGVALLPAALLILGIGPQMQISLIAYGAVWPVLLNTIDGVLGVDTGVKDVARSYRITGWQRLVRITLPAASPQIVAGMRTALAIAVTVVFFSEMVGSTNGIGYQILQAQRSFAVREMWAGMIVLGMLGYLLNIAFRGFEHVVLRWHRGMRATAR